MRGALCALSRSIARTAVTRVKPVPHTSRPQHYLVIGADARHATLEHGRLGRRRRLGRQPERDDVDRRAQCRISGIRRGSEPARRHQRPQPQVALALARAHERVTEQEPGPQRVEQEPDARLPLQSHPASNELERFKQLRVVEIHDPAADPSPETGHRAWPQHRREERGTRWEAGQEPLWPYRIVCHQSRRDVHGLAAFRGGERDLVLVGERARDLDIANPDAREARADPVGRDDHEAVHRRSASTRSIRSS